MCGGGVWMESMSLESHIEISICLCLQESERTILRHLRLGRAMATAQGQASRGATRCYYEKRYTVNNINRMNPSDQSKLLRQDWMDRVRKGPLSRSQGSLPGHHQLRRT